MPSKNDCYKPTLIQLMSFLDNVQYGQDRTFTEARLIQIDPLDIERWMKHKVYGTPTPARDAKATNCRSSSLSHWKKALSSFMPISTAWNYETKRGNPTKSKEVNQLIRKVREYEDQERMETTTERAQPPQASAQPQVSAQLEQAQNHLLHIHSQLSEMKQLLEENERKSAEFMLRMQQEMQSMNQTLGRIAAHLTFGTHRSIQQDIGTQNTAAGTTTRTENLVNGIPFECALSPNPKTLEALWQEYISGRGGRKPARCFTREERGRVKNTYSRRKVIWDCVARLVRAGFTADAAFGRIRQVYGEASSVTTIIKRMKEDAKNKVYHPSLHV